MSQNPTDTEDLDTSDDMEDSFSLDDATLIDFFPSRGLTAKECEYYLSRTKNIVDVELLYTLGPKNLVASFLVQMDDGRWGGIHFNTLKDSWVYTYLGRDGEDKEYVREIHLKAIAIDIQNMNQIRTKPGEGEDMYDVEDDS